ncbi:hypothetical protein JL722_7828 [Aureococcus anophagefferens]|nr:hypothetical protein JL722_7828 [Aureococcus anophagefferens]
MDETLVLSARLLTTLLRQQRDGHVSDETLSILRALRVEIDKVLAPPALTEEPAETHAAAAAWSRSGFSESYPSRDFSDDPNAPAIHFRRLEGRELPANAAELFRASAERYADMGFPPIDDVVVYPNGVDEAAVEIREDDVAAFLHKPYGPYVKAYFKSPEFFRNEVGGVPQGETSCVDWCFMPGGEVPKPGGDVTDTIARWDVPDVAKGARNIQIFWSLGPTDSGCHNDETDSVLIVICGQKTVHLWRHRQKRSESQDERRRADDDDPEPDDKVELGAGEALYIPTGMWHRIESVASTLAFSVRIKRESARGL